MWRRVTSGQAPAIATVPVLAMTTGSVYLIAGVCALIVVLLDPPDPHRLWLTALPAVAVAGGAVAMAVGRHFPRWVFHGAVLCGNVLITAEIALAHGQVIVGGALPCYVLVIVDAAFFFPVWGLFLHLAHFLIATVLVLPLVGVPWQVIVPLDGCCLVVGGVIAYLSRAADAAEIDPLTRLANRRGLDRRLEEAVDRSDTTGLCLVLLDLDGFKHVNDTQGHPRGDELLRICASRWRAVVPPDVEMSRYGGDEFALIVPHGVLGEAADLADRLRSVVPTGITASAGVAAWSEGDSASTLMSRADVALYDAKTSGRGRTAVYGDPSRSASELEAGIEHGELVLHYQPVVRLRDRVPVAVEALVRWQHPTRGLLPPAEFVPEAERTGAIRSLGAWTLDTACRAAATADLPKVAVNVSILELQTPSYVDMVADALRRHGLAPQRLMLEVTEAVYDEDDPHLVETLRSARELGVLIAIDDFGSGYSSLRWLDRLPLDVIKIDGTFIDAIAEDATEAPILEAIVAMARSLGTRVIAERVESEYQARLLTKLGCEYAQGFLFGAPLPLPPRPRSYVS